MVGRSQPIMLYPELDFAEELKPLKEILAAIERRIAALEVRTQEPERFVYRKSEVAKLVGVSENHLNRWVESGELRARKMGERTVLILRQDLVDFLEALPPVK